MHTPLRSLLTTLLLVLVGLTSSALAEEGRQPTHEFTLDNGLKVIVREDHRAPVVVSQLWYRVGSSYEPPGRTGLSHADRKSTRLNSSHVRISYAVFCLKK